MARKGREKSSTGVYALMLRGNRPLFVNNDDYEVFLDLMKKYFNGKCRMYAYCLSKSAVNMVVKESGEGISADIKPIVTSYARYYNRTHGFEGKLFKDRFKSEPCESDEEINNNIAFVHALYKYTDGFAVTSKSEYEHGGLCGIEKDESILKMSPVKLCLYDYSLMDDNTLIKLLSDINGDDIKKASCDELRAFIKEQGYITLSRVMRILGEGVCQTPDKVAKSREKTEEIQTKTKEILHKIQNNVQPLPKQEEKKKNSLPPWLL